MEKYLAVYADSAFSGLGILDIQYGIDDYCFVESFAGDVKKRTKNKIYYDNADGRSYIKKNGRKYFLDEFLRINV